MIKVFGPNDTVFNTHGDYVIKPLKAVVHKEDNGAFYLDIEAGLENLEYLIEGNIIVADLPQGSEPFRISNIRKTRTKISFRAYHVFYDAKQYVISDAVIKDKTCSAALSELRAATDAISPFITGSDVLKVNSYHCVRKTLYEAIFDVLEQWGGHLVRTGFYIDIMESIGQDNGVTVRYRKNLKTITCDRKWDDVVTKLLPVGKNNLLLNGQMDGVKGYDPTADIYVHSLIHYDIPYTKTLTFSQDIDQDDFKDKNGKVDMAKYKAALLEDLRAQAQAYVNSHCYPEVSYTLSANIEKLTDVGDTVEVIDERLGINVTTKVTAFDYDCILKQYTQVSFGNFQPKLSNLLTVINAETKALIQQNTQSVTTVVSAEVSKEFDAIWNVLGNSNVVYDGNNLFAFETLPVESCANVMRISSDGISFSQSGVNGPWSNAWNINSTMDFDKFPIALETATIPFNIGSTTGDITLYKAAGMVTFSFNKPITGFTGNQQIATLPDGFIPQVGLFIPVAFRDKTSPASSENYLGIMNIQITGKIRLLANSNIVLSCANGYVTGNATYVVG